MSASIELGVDVGPTPVTRKNVPGHLEILEEQLGALIGAID